MSEIDETDSPVQHDLGVLFVHGIGEQREGRTLVTFAGAIHAWLAQWDPKEKHDRRRSPLEDVVLTPSLLPTRSDRDSGGPAHGSLRTRLGVADLVLRLGAAILVMALLHTILLAAWHGVERRSTARFFSTAPRRGAGSAGSVEPPIRSSHAEAKVPATID